MIKGGQQSQLLYVNSPVKQPPVHKICPNFAWRVQMGLGLHEKKMEAIRPLTLDFHKLASIKGPIKHQPVDRDCAWRVQMGLGFNKKNGGHMASDLRFSYAGLYGRSHKTSTSGPLGPRLCMEGTNGIRFA